MSGTSLQDFVCRALEHKRISFGDLRRLQRDILPDRITTREEAEILLALDRSVDRADRSWRDYLVKAVRDFVIWGSPPAGHIDGDKAQWMMTALSSSSAKTARALTLEIMRAGPEFDDDLRAVAAHPQPNAPKKQQSTRRKRAGNADAKRRATVQPPPVAPYESRGKEDPRFHSPRRRKSRPEARATETVG
jgi:hypothetical protein